MGETTRYQEILRRLAIVDEGAVHNVDHPACRVMDPRTAALVQLGALVALGSPAVCLEWGTGQALAAGASEDEITDVLLAVAPAAGLCRIVGATVGIADGLGYDVQAALLDASDR